MNNNIKKKEINKLDQLIVSSQINNRENKETNLNKETTSIKESKNRCFFCNKKLKIHSIYSCKCNNIFCAKHRYYHTHNCIYDNKKEQIENIKNNNPLIIHNKISKIN